MSKLVTLRKSEDLRDDLHGSMRILLISPSYASGPNTMYFPIGLSYISSYIRNLGHDVVALNMNNYDAEERDRRLTTLLEDQTIDVVGLSALTVAFNEIERLVRFIRPRTDAKIVLGGGITSCESEIVMQAIRPDFMVVGEGELIFARLLKALEKGQDPGRVQGIWYWKDSQPVATGEGLAVPKLDDLPQPDLDLFGMQEYLQIQSDQRVSYHITHLYGAKHIPITASRSCPFRCTFCYHAGMGTYRRHSIPNVVEHIRASVEKFGVRHVLIYDELFSANKKRLYEFCELVESFDITWFCQLRVDQIDEILLHRMRKAGCVRISYGFESGSDAILTSMDKKISASQIRDAVVATRRAKIGIQANFLFGDPAETVETLTESLQFQDDHDLAFVDWSAVIPYPGTRIYNHALNQGLIEDREQFVRAMGNVSSYLWKHMVNLTSIPDERFMELYTELRERNDVNHRRHRTLKTSGHVSSVTSSQMDFGCPYCDHIETDTAIHYPPESAQGAPVNICGAIAVTGLNILCPACKRKHHLAAKDIPHVGRHYASFQSKLDVLKEAQSPVVMLPALDRYATVVSEDMDFSKLNIEAVLDTRKARIGEQYAGKAVEELTGDAVREHPDATFLILPWVEYENALQVLALVGVQSDRILSWNLHFGAGLSGSVGERYCPPNSYRSPSGEDNTVRSASA
ncbi:MAG: radical SAM protein [Myxococcota bacterium]